MSKGYETQRIYCELAEWYEAHSQAQMRDRFLLLAADTALSEGMPEEAERLRQRLLQHSPHHMLRPFASFAEAMRSPDVQGYINDLRHTYPPETAEQLLMSVRSEGEPEAAAPSPPPASDLPAAGNHAPTPAAEPLKVYRVRDEERRAAPAAAPPRPAAPRKPAPAPPPPKPAPRPVPPAVSAPAPRTPVAVASPPPARPVLRPQREAARPQPKPVRQRPRRPGPVDEEEDGEGGWVGVGLFVLVLAASIALAVYTFARPFIPAQWLP